MAGHLTDPQAALLAASSTGGGTPSQTLARAAKFLEWLNDHAEATPQFGFGAGSGLGAEAPHADPYPNPAIIPNTRPDPYDDRRSRR